MSATRPKFRGYVDHLQLPSAFDWWGQEGVEFTDRGKVWRTGRCAFHGPDRKPSARYNASGGFACLSCGAKGGDLIAFLMQRDGLTFVEAAQALGAWVGEDAAPKDASERDKRLVDAERVRRETAERAAAEQRRQWTRQEQRLAKLRAAARAIAPGDAAALYLAARGLALASWPAALRLAPRLDYRHDDGQTTLHPAMLAEVRSPAGELVALHRTYLTPEGGKARVPTVKKLTPTAGPMAGAAVRLFEPGDDGVLGVAEGIETALAAHLGSGVPTWAAVSAHGMQTFAWPAGTRRLIVFADHDASGTGARAADALAVRARAAGLSVSVLMPTECGTDWADVWAQRDREGAAA